MGCEGGGGFGPSGIYVKIGPGKSLNANIMNVFLKVKLLFFRIAFKFLELQSSFLVKYT